MTSINIQPPVTKMEKKQLNQTEVVCVTGGSGYIGSWIVRVLLERGYTVHATVQDLKNENETKHLESLEGANTRLRLFQMDLLDYDSIAAAVCGTKGVFHVATPVILYPVPDPQQTIWEPAVNGTLNVLKVAKEAGVKRVVVTSSVSAIVEYAEWSSDTPNIEDCWSDVEYLKQRGLWYMASKVLAEQAAWKFSKENNIDMAVLNPGLAVGPTSSPVLNASMNMVLAFIQGQETPVDFVMGVVHVKDVALAHILVYENTNASGRHLCVEGLTQYSDFAAKVEELYPEYKLHRLPKETEPRQLRTHDASKKLMDLGLKFIPMAEVIKETVDNLKSSGYLS